MVDVLSPDSIPDPEKAAFFLMAMGEEFTARVFEKMSEKEIGAVAFAMSSIDNVSPEMFRIVYKVFLDKFDSEIEMIPETNDFLRNIVKRTLKDNDAEALFEEIENKKREAPFLWSRHVNVETLASYVVGEHPQTIAMILAHMPSEISSEILMSLPQELKGDIAMRIVKLGQISEDVVRAVDEILQFELSSAVGTGGKAGGLQVLVDIITRVDKITENSVIEFVDEGNPEMANDIRKLMFVFEDLAGIDDMAMREILKKIEGRQLTYALKTATDEMKEKIFSNLSQRAGEMLKDDLDALGPVRLTEVEEAQQAVVRAAKELEEDGTVTLGKGKDDVLV